MKHLAIVLSLVLAFTVSTHAAYSADYAKEMVYVSGLAYCPAANILARKCNKATDLTEGAGMTVLHAKDNGLDKNGITYVILKRDKTKELFMAFSGTRDTAQLITEIGEAFPVKYSIHTEVKGALVFDYFECKFLIKKYLLLCLSSSSIQKEIG